MCLYDAADLPDGILEKIMNGQRQEAKRQLHDPQPQCERLFLVPAAYGINPLVDPEEHQSRYRKKTSEIMQKV